MHQGTSSKSTLPWRFVAAAYFLAISLGHLEFSLWLVRHRQTAFGPLAFKDFVPALTVAAGMCLVGCLYIMVRRSPRPGGLLAYWVVWGGWAWLMDAFLTCTVNEYAHYPEYALQAWLLARCMDPTGARQIVARVIFWTTLLGASDECMQYLWITASYSDYLDFNDVLMNLLAATAGGMIYYGFKKPIEVFASVPPPRLEISCILIFLVILAIGIQTGKLVTAPTSSPTTEVLEKGVDGRLQLHLQRHRISYGGYLEGPHRGRYWVLDPFSGLMLLLVAGMVFGSAAKVFLPDRSAT